MRLFVFLKVGEILGYIKHRTNVYNVFFPLMFMEFRKNINLNMYLFLLVAFSLFSSFFVSSLSESDFNIELENTQIDFDMSSDVMTLTYLFEEPEVIETSEGIEVSIPGLYNSYVPNTPSLPVRTSRVLVPKGYAVDNLEIDYNSYVVVARGNAVLSEEILPTSDVLNQAEDLAVVNDSISDSLFVSDFKGYKILGFDLSPVKYEGNELRFYNKVVVKIKIKRQDADYSQLRNNVLDRKDVVSMVDNPEAIESYNSPRTFGLSTSSFSEISAQYLIITNEDLMNSSEQYNFTTLLDSKTNRTNRPNITGKKVTVEEIYANSSFYCDGLWGDGCVESINNASTYFSIPFVYKNQSSEEILSGYNSFKYVNSGLDFLTVNISSPNNNSYFNRSLIPINLTWAQYSTPWLIQSVTFEYSVDNSTFVRFTPNVDSANFNDVINNSLDQQDFVLYLRVNYSMRNNGSLFNDSAAMIRNYIKYAYQNLGTRWVLLGGDVSVIPARKIYSRISTFSDPIVQNIISDNYYSNLDGSFNSNYNEYWGDNVTYSWVNGYISEKDDYYEVFVGRMPVETQEELNNIIRKTLFYENITSNLSLDDSKYLRNSMYVQDPSVYFSSLPNLMFSQNLFKNIIRDWGVSSANYAFISYLNSSVRPGNSPHIINYAGHGSYYSITGGFQTHTPSGIGNVEGLTNKYPFFLAADSCTPANFAMNDSVFEELMFANNGSFAILGNVGNGWYGSIPYEYNKVWSNLFANKSLSIGEGHASGMRSSNSYFQLMYWSSVLLGDPELHLFLDIDGMEFYTLNISSPIEGNYYNYSNISLDFNLNDGESIFWRMNDTQNNSYGGLDSYNFSTDGVYNITIVGNNSLNEEDETVITFTIDTLYPRVNSTIIGGEGTRYSSFQLNSTFNETTFCLMDKILEMNITGNLENYTYTAQNYTGVDFSVSENITTIAKNFSYRFYLEDCAGNYNITDWILVNVTNTNPILNSRYENNSIFLFGNETFYLNEIFSDLDSDNLTFANVSSENISYSLNETSLVISSLDENTKGNIVLAVSDSSNITNFTLNFNFYVPKILNTSSNSALGFDGNTTKLSGNYTNIPFVLEKSSYGKIEFDSANITVPEISSELVSISRNKVFVNSSYLPGLDTHAKVSLKLDSSVGQYCEGRYAGRYTPVVYKIESNSSASVCTECTFVSCNPNTKVFVFNVSGFSTYEIRAPNCLDGIQNQDETGVDCGGVCPSCPSGSSGGSGGGGGGGSSDVNITREINQTILLGKSFKFYFGSGVYWFNVTNITVDNVSIKISSLGNDIMIKGETNIIDIDNDGFNDLKITYLGNISPSFAKFNFAIYNLPILFNPIDDKGYVSPEQISNSGKIYMLSWWKLDIYTTVFVLLVFIVLFSVGLLIFLSKRLNRNNG